MICSNERSIQLPQWEMRVKALALTVAVIATLATAILAPPLGGALVLTLAAWKIGLISAALAGLGAIVAKATFHFFNPPIKEAVEQIKEKELPDSSATDLELTKGYILLDALRGFQISIQIDRGPVQKITRASTEEDLMRIFESLKAKLGADKATKVLSYLHQGALSRDMTVLREAGPSKADMIQCDADDRNRANGVHVALKGEICSVETRIDQKGSIVPSMTKLRIKCHARVANIFEEEMSVTRSIKLTNI